MCAVVVFYHGPSCSDGFGAAYAAWTYFKDRAEYRSVPAGAQPPPDFDPTGKTISVLDVCIPRADLESWELVAKSLLVLDHHETIMRDLQGCPHAIFYMDKCGARLAWEYFRATSPV